MKQEIVSVYTVTTFRTGKQEEISVRGSGQSVINFLRKQYPRLTKFVLEGFEIDGNFVPLDLRTYNRIS